MEKQVIYSWFLDHQKTIIDIYFLRIHIHSVSSLYFLIYIGPLLNLSDVPDFELGLFNVY